MPKNASQMAQIIRQMASQDEFDILYKKHAKERLGERNLIVGDVIYILKNGDIYEEPENSTRAGCYKYKMESETPNSDTRLVRIVIIPDEEACSVKIVTVMWVDEN